MKRIVLSSVLFLILLPAVAAAAEQDVPRAADGYLSDAEKTDLVAILEGARRDLLERVTGLGDKAFHFQPAPDRWSIAQVIEHLVIVEADVIGYVEKAMAAPSDPEWATATAGAEDRLYRLVPLRLQRFQAPESVQPKSEMSRREILGAFERLRARSIAFVNDAREPVKAHTTDHPVLGRLSATQWLLFAALHNVRHNQQVVEVMADPGFPH